MATNRAIGSGPALANLGPHPGWSEGDFLDDPSKLSEVIKERRLKLQVQCSSGFDGIFCLVIFWESKQRIPLKM